jgi:hypothetical protein
VFARDQQLTCQGKCDPTVAANLENPRDGLLFVNTDVDRVACADHVFAGGQPPLTRRHIPVPDVLSCASAAGDREAKCAEQCETSQGGQSRCFRSHVAATIARSCRSLQGAAPETLWVRHFAGALQRSRPSQRVRDVPIGSIPPRTARPRRRLRLARAACARVRVHPQPFNGQSFTTAREDEIRGPGFASGRAHGYSRATTQHRRGAAPRQMSYGLPLRAHPGKQVTARKSAS